MRNIVAIVLLLNSIYQPALNAQTRLTPVRGRWACDFEDVINGQELTVIVFNSTECPICQRYCLGISGLVNRLDSLGINTYFVYHSYLAKRNKVRHFHRQSRIGVPEQNILLDPQMVLVKKMSATVTPQFFLVDSLGRVRYTGKLDNRFESIGVERKIISEHYLLNAVNQYRLGQSITVPETEPVGCLIPQ